MDRIFLQQHDGIERTWCSTRVEESDDEFINIEAYKQLETKNRELEEQLKIIRETAIHGNAIVASELIRREKNYEQN